MKRYPHGTPLSSIERDFLSDSSASDLPVFSVASFNLLAPLYVRPIDKRTGKVQSFAAFEWVEDDSVLDWNHRQLYLLQRLRDCTASIICLQELQLQKVHNTTNIDNKKTSHLNWPLPSWIQPLLTDDGYEAIIPSIVELDKIGLRNLRVLGVEAAVTCAILVKSKLWEILSTRLESNNVVSVCVQQKTNNPQLNPCPVVMNCLHLDAKDEMKRLAQFTKALDFSRDLLHNHLPKADSSSSNSSIHPLTAIFAGDMNAEFLPATGMHALLQSYQPDQYTEEEYVSSRATAYQFNNPSEIPALSDWKKLQSDIFQRVVEEFGTSLDRLRLGPTRCALDDTDRNNVEDAKHTPSSGRGNKMATWKLDHIIYTTDRLRPVAQWETLEADPESCKVGLPNTQHPTSDHLPIGALFRIDPLPIDLMDAEKRRSIKESVARLDQQQIEACNNLNTEMEAKRLEIELRLGSISVDDRITEVKKNKKAAKGRPPAEVVECLREKRRRLRALHIDQKCERETFANSLVGRYEKLMLQDVCGRQHWKKWVDEGSTVTKSI